MSAVAGTVVVEVVDGVGVLRLDRPPANAIDAGLSRDLAAAADDLGRRPDVGALVVHGGDRLFSAGADIREMAGHGPDEARALSRALGDAIDAIAGLEVVSIAAIEGIALGGGLELAMGCDLRVVADGATLGLPEITLGVMPGAGGTQRLPRLVGAARARDLVLTGRRVRADEAHAMGLADRVVPDGSAFHAAMDLARAFAAGPRDALAAARRALDAAGGDLAAGIAVEREAFATLFGGADQREGMAAFLEKRPPRFGGRA